jgi:hypothetical protein
MVKDVAETGAPSVSTLQIFHVPLLLRETPPNVEVGVSNNESLNEALLINVSRAWKPSVWPQTSRSLAPTRALVITAQTVSPKLKSLFGVVQSSANVAIASPAWRKKDVQKPATRNTDGIGQFSEEGIVPS